MNGELAVYADVLRMHAGRQAAVACRYADGTSVLGRPQYGEHLTDQNTLLAMQLTHLHAGAWDFSVQSRPEKADSSKAIYGLRPPCV